MRIFVLLADALEYPDQQSDNRLGEFAAALVEFSRNGRLTPENLAGVEKLVEQFRRARNSAPLSRLEEIYTSTFDLRADCSLYAGYHLFGDDWRRSSYLVQLRQRYRLRSFPAGAEMPDHIPTMLRFLARPGALEDADEIIGECLIPAVSQILDRIKGAANPYQFILEALLICLRAVCVSQEATASAGNKQG